MQHKHDILISYAYARNSVEDFDKTVNLPNVNILLDSGAYTAHMSNNPIDLDEYCEFVARWKHKLFAYIALDVIGDSIKTRHNYEQMRLRGLAPIPVVTFGDSFYFDIEDATSYSSYICIGGLVSGTSQRQQVVKSAMANAKGCRVHWLGYAREHMIRAFNPYSVDSSTWTYPGRFGRLSIYLGNGQWSNKLTWHTRHTVQPTKAKTFITNIGLGYNDPDTWRGQNMLDVGFESFLRYSHDVHIKLGTRMFLVSPGHQTNFIPRYFQERVITQQ